MLFNLTPENTYLLLAILSLFLIIATYVLSKVVITEEFVINNDGYSDMHLKLDFSKVFKK
jgi:hypothetical protein